MKERGRTEIKEPGRSRIKGQVGAIRVKTTWLQIFTQTNKQTNKHEREREREIQPPY